ncbi:cytochrome b5-like [Diorhabda carinulata]|uniref:cytochrome b5-like n=1 Tax=Diorhabda carinulata TaxID=1163345 RepID=UPI0025A0BA2F|nr:cytochrome b5-like [Diorhabda carinulata]
MSVIAENKYYTLEEISRHDGKQDTRVWIIIKDIVYDVTDYLDEHPGGGELITEWAGKDATKEFDDFGHSLDAKKDLKKYRIGEVVEEQRKKKTKTDDKKLITVPKNQKMLDSSNFRYRKSCISIITCGILT